MVRRCMQQPIWQRLWSVKNCLSRIRLSTWRISVSRCILPRYSVWRKNPGLQKQIQNLTSSVLVPWTEKTENRLRQEMVVCFAYRLSESRLMMKFTKKWWKIVIMAKRKPERFQQKLVWLLWNMVICPIRHQKIIFLILSVLLPLREIQDRIFCIQL